DVWSGKTCTNTSACNSAPYPYSNGNKIAAVWSQPLASKITGQSNAKFVMVIDGKYWVWRSTSSLNKWFKAGSAASIFNGAPSCSGKYPTTDNGPEALSTTNDGAGIHVYNEGCVWKYAPNNSGIWQWTNNAWTPKPVSTTFSSMPAVGGLKPNNPEAAVQFINGRYLHQNQFGYTGKSTQHVLFEKGRVWFTDNNGYFEKWNNVWSYN
ncbi:MAG: hypothetical protein AAF485_09300, partial [Chloroflexota bacterium]